MAKYAVVIRYSRRVREAFTEEQLETAARVAFYGHPPDGLGVYTAPYDLRLDWTDEETDGYRIVRVLGEVQHPSDN